jgi:hypothetical protein
MRFYVIALVIFGSKFPPRTLGPSVGDFTILGVCMLVLFGRQTPASCLELAGYLVVECLLDFGEVIPQKND